MSNRVDLPLPPLEYRGWVSPITVDSYYDNPSGDYVWGPLNIGLLAPGEAYRRILDFGCGCGREIRRLLMQRDPPKEIVGLDVNRRMIDWCTHNLARPGVSFVHHDVWSQWYAPDNSRNRVLPLTPAGSGFSLIEANSVFTHLLEDQSVYYLEQMSSMLAPAGLIRATWFFINKRAFPMMSDSQNTVLIDEVDPTKAVFYDWEFFVRTTRRLGYRIVKVEWALNLGLHNTVFLGRDDTFAELQIISPPGASCLGF